MRKREEILAKIIKISAKIIGKGLVGKYLFYISRA
jgi:hypothetical protein